MEDSYMKSHQIKSEEEVNLLQSVDGLVVFENLDGEYLPDYLSYTIHLRNHHHLTVMSRRRDYEHLDELSESFLRLQWAIDSSFIKLKAHIDEDLQNITMKQLRVNNHKLAPDRIVSDIILFSVIAVTFIAPIFSFTQIILRMNEEKITGIQISEMAGASSLMICLSQLVNSFPPALMIAVGGSIVCPLLNIEANPLIKFIGWFLHYMTVIAIAFVLSYITKTSIAIDFSTWSGEYHRFDDGSKSGSVRLSFVMQFLQIVMWLLLAFYLELVRQTCLRYIVAARLQVYDLSQEFEDIVEDFSVFDGTLEDGFHFVQDNRFKVRQALTW